MKIRPSVRNLERRISHMEQRIANTVYMPVGEAEILFSLPHETDTECLQAYLTSNVSFSTNGIALILRRNGDGFTAHAYKEGIPYISPITHNRYALTEIDWAILNMVEEEGMRQCEQAIT